MQPNFCNTAVPSPHPRWEDLAESPVAGPCTLSPLFPSLWWSVIGRAASTGAAELPVDHSAGRDPLLPRVVVVVVVAVGLDLHLDLRIA